MKNLLIKSSLRFIFFASILLTSVSFINIVGCSNKEVGREKVSANYLKETKDFERPDFSKIERKITNKFNFILGFGIYSRDILNTFDGTFTADLVKGFSTIEFKLLDDEMNLIKKRMEEINIFNYPDEFKPKENGHLITPFSTYYLRVELNGKIKEISWKDENESLEKDAVQLRNLIKDIEQIVYKSEEYKKIPPAEGGYD